MSIWSGVENGIITADSSPAEFAPTSQQSLQWPKWGQYFETSGKAGEKPEGKHITQLLKLHQQWQTAATKNDKFKLWEKILRIHADKYTQ